VRWAVDANVDVLPTFEVPLVGVRDVGLRNVYDLTVPSTLGDDYASFVVNGVLVHNCPGALNADSKLIAEWSNGVPLVAELQRGKGRVVVLNFFPPSSDTGDPRFWVSSTDGHLLLSNALAYVGRSSALKKLRHSMRSLSAEDKSMQEGATRGSPTGANKIHKKHRIGRKILSRLFSSLRPSKSE